MLEPAFDSADYELAWPREVFTHELAAIIRVPRTTAIKRFLREAFSGEEPRRAFAAVEYTSQEAAFLQTLLRHSGAFPLPTAERPYWSARRSAPGARVLGTPALFHRFAQLVSELQADGYLDKELTAQCPAEPDVEPVDPNRVLAERLGLANLWPLKPENWSRETFYDLVEVFHDLVARPRHRESCNEPECIGHFWSFSTETGRALYRWRTNLLLDESGLGLHLAAGGPDVGRLVQVADAARTELVERALATPDGGAAGRIEHAIATFRGRKATEHEKRSAVLTLAGVLEERRELIRNDLGRKDEGTLFRLANEFAIRHQNRGQQGDYDPAFLDWMFWWYLATIEVTDRIIDRQSPSTATARG